MNKMNGNGRELTGGANIRYYRYLNGSITFYLIVDIMYSHKLDVIKYAKDVTVSILKTNTQNWMRTEVGKREMGTK